jgi:hypothetical protein
MNGRMTWWPISWTMTSWSWMTSWPQITSWPGMTLLVMNDLVKTDDLPTHEGSSEREWLRDPDPQITLWPWMCTGHKFFVTMYILYCITSWPPEWPRDPEWTMNHLLILVTSCPEWPFGPEFLSNLAWPQDHKRSARESGWDCRCDGAADGLVGDHLRGHGGGKGKSRIPLLHFRHLWTPHSVLSTLCPIFPLLFSLLRKKSSTIFVKEKNMVIPPHPTHIGEK